MNWPGHGLAAAATLAVLLTPPAVDVTPPPVVQPRAVPHVLVIVEENRTESAVIGSSDAPYLNGLAALHGVATAAYGQGHPSLPNYLELISGSTHGITDDGTGYALQGPTLVDELAATGIGWKAYMEGMPSPCYAGAGKDGYAKKHNPFMYFTSITNDASRCNRVVPFSDLTGDLAQGTAPAFLWVTPDLCDDGHDCSTQTMDSWLAATLPPVLASTWYAQDGIVIITWDEGGDSSGCCSGAAGGHVATVVVSSRLSAPATSTTAVDHAGTLRTIEALYGLPFLADAACVCSGDLLLLTGSTPPLSTAVYTWLTVAHKR